MDFMTAYQVVRILIIGSDKKSHSKITSFLGEDYEYVRLSETQAVFDYLKDNGSQTALVMVDMDYEALDPIKLLMDLNVKGYMDYIPVIAFARRPDEDLKGIAYDMGVADFLTINSRLNAASKRVKNTIRIYMKGRSRELFQAEYDSITGTLNLVGLRRRFTELVRTYPECNYVVIYSDLKNFKYFNSNFGYEEGNRLLRYWCDTIRRYSNPEDLVCRITGDQIVLVHKTEDDVNMDPYGKMILNEVRAYFADQIGDFTIDITAGVYIYSPRSKRGESFDQIIGFAKQAQKSIKGDAGSDIACYDDKMWRSGQRKIEINGHLEQAIKDGEIMVYFQPQYNYVSQELIGAECLCRWNHVSMGMLSPGEFIPALEESGKIYELDQYVWETACQCLRKWRDEGYELSLAVNVSRKDIERLDLPEHFLGLIEKYSLSPKMLRIEITESIYMESADYMTTLVKRFSDYGFSVEMDDFGSGYSSLNLLHNIDVDVLKLDMGFLRDTDNGSRSGSIINAIVKMAHILNIRVLAEGVENQSQAEFLKNIGCIMAQGYYFSKPIALEEFEELLKNTMICQIDASFDKYQLFNLQELFDRKSSGFFLFNNCMGPAILFDYDGKSVSPVIANDEMMWMLGMQREDMVTHRRNLLPVFGQRNQKLIKELIDRSLRDGVSFGEIHTVDNKRFVHAFFRHLSTNYDVDLIFCEATDITNEKLLEAKISELTDVQQAQMKFMPCGTYRAELGGEQRIVYASETMATMMGYKNAEEFLKKNPNYSSIIFEQDLVRTSDIIDKQLEDGDEAQIEHRLLKADGTTIWVYENGRIVADADGKMWSYVVVTNIENLKQKEMESLWYEKKLQAVLEIPGIVLYEYDPAKDTMTVSIKIDEGDRKERSTDKYLECLEERNWVHRDYIKNYKKAICAAVETGEPQTVIARTIFADGEYRLCKFYFSPINNELGEIYRVIGRAEQIDDASDVFFENMPVGTFRYKADGDQNFDFIGKNLVEMLGFKNEREFREFYKNSFLHFVHPDDVERVQKEIEEQIENQENDYCEYRVITANGSVKWLYDRGTIVTDEYGTRWFYVAVTDLDSYKEEQMRQLTGRENLMSKLKQSAQQDSMTKLYNHEYTFELVERYLEKGEPGIFMLIDVDDFKWVNDNLGHAYGDQVLCDLADILKDEVRDNDVVGRYGGDEFVIYISGTDSVSVAKRKAKEILSKVQGIMLDENRTLSVSIGIVTGCTNVSKTKELVMRADEALYRVKGSGKANFDFY